MRPVVMVALLIGCAAKPQRAPEATAVGPAAPEWNELRAGSLSDESRRFLENADDLELVAFDPDGRGSYTVRARASIRDAATRRELVDALDAGFRAASEFALCFEPRLTLRATRGGETLLLKISFSCFRVLAEGTGARGVPGAISRSPEEVVDRILSAHGAPPAAPSR